MTKEEFLTELKKNLKYLNKKEREEELVYYENLDNYNLDPIAIAYEIYQRKSAVSKSEDPKSSLPSSKGTGAFCYAGNERIVQYCGR